MTAVAPRPPLPRTLPPEPAPVASAEASGPPAPSFAAGLACLLLVLAACLPLDRVFVDRSWATPVASATVIALGLAWGARRFGLGPIGGLLVSAAGWALFSGLAFLPDTLLGGVLPTGRTVSTGAAAWAHGLELLRIRPSPAVPETGLVLITASGVWAVAYAVHELVFRVRAPLRAVLMALVLWVVPLGLATNHSSPLRWTLPFLGAVVLLLLASSGSDTLRWGRWSPEAPGRGALRTTGALNPLGWLLAAIAVAASTAIAPTLPGWTDPALYELRDIGGSTTTTNPMVSLRASLLDPDPTPVLTVRTPRPVYLRLTSLDLYSELEEWTNGGIRGRSYRPGSGVPFETAIGHPQQVPVDVTVGGLDQAVLVPMPYQPAVVDGSIGASLQYDQRLSTFTLERGVRLTLNDTYAVTAAVPAPPADALDVIPAGWYSGPLTALPGNVPAEVAELARAIVREAGAATPFRQAMAVQEELRTWTYSLDPPQGHGSAAMRAFLQHRTGYCEQFAGTMAVMLRTLGIPARVGVGFTPGEPIDDGQYLVRASNAHAWVEVLFPNEGWVAFEPTPRTDGNVLVPTPANLAPSTLQGQGDFEDLPDDAPQQGPDPLPTNRPSAAPTPTAVPGAGGGADSGTPTSLFVLGALLLSALGGGAALYRGQRVDLGTLGPAQRVVHAVSRVEALALGLERPRKPAETDREFLTRLTRSEDAPRLAAHAEQARYATQLPITAIHEAEGLAAGIIERLLYPLDRRKRLLVRWRAAVLPLRRRLGAALTGFAGRTGRRG